MVNGVKKVTARPDANPSAEYDHSTNMVLAHCTKGNKVWVQTIHTSKVADNGNNYISFSGMLLKKD